MSDSRGLTLTELVIVMAMASLVMVGLVTFYISSQGTWFDGSAQAMTQRDATLLLEGITREVRASASAIVNPAGNGFVLYDAALRERGRFWLAGDSLVHYGTGSDSTDDRGPVVTSKLAAFAVRSDSGAVHLDTLRMRTLQGDVVEMSSIAAFYQRP